MDCLVREEEAEQYIQKSLCVYPDLVKKYQGGVCVPCFDWSTREKNNTERGARVKSRHSKVIRRRPANSEKQIPKSAEWALVYTQWHWQRWRLTPDSDWAGSQSRFGVSFSRRLTLLFRLLQRSITGPNDWTWLTLTAARWPSPRAAAHIMSRY